MDIILYIIFGLFLVEHILLLIGLRKNMKTPEAGRYNESNLPFVSIIVAGRNEALNIEPCIKSLLNLDYPSDKHEIFLVNDRSTDNTGSINEKIFFSDKFKRNLF